MRKHSFHSTSMLMVPLASSEARFLALNVNSSGVIITVGDDAADAAVVYAGTGRAKVKVLVEGGTLWARPLGKDMVLDLEIPELRWDEGGWLDEPSLTDLQPRPFGGVSPEIKAVMDYMNRNAIIREQAMLRSLGNR